MAAQSTQTNGSNSNGASPKITFYTNHLCPWAHRVSITLKALNLPYEEVIVDILRPREQWYLDINPAGLVPALRISHGPLKDEIITESAVIATFLADAFPNSAFYPRSNESETSALTRARMTTLVDTWVNKINIKYFYPMFKAEGQEQEKLAGEAAATVEKEIEPLLSGIGPFFGGSKVLTLAEAMIAPLVLRCITFGERGVLPTSLAKSLKALPNLGKWSQALFEQEAVMYVYDADFLTKMIQARMEKEKAEKK